MTNAKDIATIANSAEAKFAQRLAANEKKIRDRAFKKLRQYLTGRSASPRSWFSRDELMRIWKGLFYCMWMSDKPLVQEELARGIAKLLIGLKTTKSAMMYLETFFATMSREWMGIDRLRMDKFLLLCRFMTQYSFVCMRESGWDEGVIEWTMGILRNSPLAPTAPGPNSSAGPPLGLRYHIIDVYIEELSACADENLTPEKAQLLLLPFVNLVCTTPVCELRNLAFNKVFQEIIDQSEPAQKVILEVNPEEEITKPSINFNYSSIANLLFDAANSDDTLPRNRKKAYAYVKKFNGIADGQLPLDDLPNILPDENISKQDQEKKFLKRMTAELESEYSKIQMEKQNFKKSRKIPHELEEDDGFHEAEASEPRQEKHLTEKTLKTSNRANTKRKSLSSAAKTHKHAKKQKLLEMLKSDEQKDTNSSQDAVSEDLQDDAVANDTGENSQQTKEDIDCTKNVTKAQKKTEEKVVSIVSVSPVPTSTFLNVAKSKVKKQQGHKILASRKSKSLVKNKTPSKRVSFEMAKIQVQAFRKTDKSIAVSPSPSSIAFDPNKTPDFGLLKRNKTPLKATKLQAKKRKIASDFF